MNRQQIVRALRRRLVDWTFNPADIDPRHRHLWSKGYPLLCDFGGPPGYALHHTEKVQAADDIRAAYSEAHGLVWVRLGTGARDGKTVDLDHFAQFALPTIDRPFALLTTDGDASVPSELKQDTVTRLLNSPFLIAWLTQNHDGGGGPKLSPLPIGLDLHTPRPMTSPRRLADTLDRIARRRTPPHLQPLQVFCDMNLSAWPGPRREMLAALDHCGHVVMQDRRVPQQAIWQRYADFPFVLSTHGWGLDCHRTWEALYLGSIVITRKSSLDPLYEGLPVVIVEDWDEVREPDNLKRWRDEFAELAAPDRIARQLDARSRIAAIRSRLQAV